MMARPGLLLALLLTWATAAQADESWSRQQVADHPITVELPAPATSTHETSSWGPFGTAETDGLESPLQGGFLSAFATVAPSWAIRGAGRDLIFLTTRDTILRKRGGQARGWEPIERGGRRGMRLTYKVRGEPTRVGLMEVYVEDPFILAFEALLPEGTAPDAIDRFFGSIRITLHD